MKTKRLITSIISLSLAGILLTGCANPFAKKEEEAVNDEIIVDVITAVPVTQDIALNSEFFATVEADKEVKVIPKVSGEVLEKNFEIGDHVNEGDFLFKIDDEAYRISMKQAEAALATAKANYTSQQASTAYANIAGVETIGKIPTTDQKMSNAIDSAYAGQIAASNTLGTGRATDENYQRKLQELRDDLDDAEDDKDDAKNRGDEAAYQAAKEKIESLENSIKDMKYTIKTNNYSSSTAEANLWVAQENVDMARREKADYDLYGKSTTLYGVNNSVVGAESALKTAQQNIKSAEATLENAQLAIDNTVVTAPVSGTIIQINVSEHNMTSPSEAAYIIESDAKNKIVFYVTDETAANIKPGNPATVKKGNNEYTAKITNVYDTLDQTNGLYKVEAAADTDDLPTGSDVSLTTTTRHSKNVLTVPVNAVYYDGEQPYLLVNENSVAVRKDITTGLTNDTNVEVSEGIDADTQVIVSYSSQLKDGVKLNASKQTQTAPAEASKGE